MHRVVLLVLLLAACIGGWLLLRDDAPRRDTPSGKGASSESPTEGAEPGEPGLEGREGVEPATQPTETETAPDSDAMHAIGRVVDEARRPVEGAQVLATFQHQPTDLARSDTEGRFDVALVAPGRAYQRGVLEVRAGSRRAVRSISVGPDYRQTLDFGDVVVREGRSLTVRVLHGGAPVAGAAVIAGGDLLRSGHAPGVKARSGPDGLARLQGLLGARAHVHVAKQGLGRGYAQVRLPADDAVEILLPADRAVTVRVVRAGGGEAVAGAEVHLAGAGTMVPPAGPGCLPPLPSLRTNALGEVVVEGLPAGHLMVSARAEGLAMRNQGMMLERVSVRPEEERITVTLHPYRTVRFPIHEASVRVPPEGSTLGLRRYQPLPDYEQGWPKARIEKGHVVLEPFPPGHDWGHVTTEDGLWAKWMVPMESDVGEAVTFRPIHDLEVRLTWPDGSPAVGQWLWANLQPRGRRAPRRTDTGGRARFEACAAESAFVFWTSNERGFGIQLGSTSLLADPGTLAFTIERPVDVALAVRVNGEPRIPFDYHVRVPNPESTRPGALRTVHGEIEEDAEHDVLRFRWLPMPDGTAPPVTLRAEGHAPTTAQPRRDADGVWRATLDLRSAPTLRVRVNRPDGTRYWLMVERWNEEHERWVYLHDDPAYRSGRREVDGLHIFQGFKEGRYRLKDHRSGLYSEPFDLVPGGDDVDMTLDLGEAGVVKGRVIVPAGEEVAYTVVRVDGRRDGRVSILNPLHVEADGTFEYSAPQGETHRLVADHPLLEMAGGAVEVTVGNASPEIRLRAGPQIQFRLKESDLTTREPARNMSPSWWSPVQVRYSPVDRWEPDPRARPAMAQAGRCRAGAPGRGAYTVRIERRGFVPYTLDRVEIGERPTDLGTITLSEGSTLTVRLHPGEKGLPRMVRIQAEHQGDRPYTRSGSKIEGADPPSVTVRGLGRGTFLVNVRSGYGPAGGVVASQEVTVDGETPATIDVRLP